MSVQAYVGSFNATAGAGTRVVTGIVDASSAAFTPKVVLFFGGSGSSFGRFEQLWLGIDDGVTPYGLNTMAAPFAIGGVAYRSSFSSTTYSITRTDTGFPPPHLITSGKISALGSGTFTVTFASSDDAGNIIQFLALGGSDLQYTIVNFPTLLASPTSITGFGFTPHTLITWFRSETSIGTNPEQTLAGMPTFGWAASPGQQGAVAFYDQANVNPSNAKRYERSTLLGAHFKEIDASLNTLSLDSFDSDGITVSGTAPDGDPGFWTGLALNVSSFAGVATQPLAPGSQILTGNGVTPLAALFISVDGVASSSAQSNARMSIGAIDGTRQAAHWLGNDSGINPDDPVTGNWTDRTVVMAHPTSPGATPSGAIDAYATATFSGTTVPLTWVAADAVAREFLYLILEGVPTPPPVGVTRTFRRVRRFPIAFEDNRQIFLSRLEVLCQPGVGTTTGQGSAPLVMFRLSKDGGSTFGNEIQMSLGALGQYDFRTYVNRLPRGRNLVGEISCSDPVFWAVLDAFCDYSVGPS